jgi:hypothetical protein
VNADRGATPTDFLWLLLPLAVLAAFRKGAVPAGSPSASPSTS